MAKKFKANFYYSNKEDLSKGYYKHIQKANRMIEHYINTNQVRTKEDVIKLIAKVVELNPESKLTQILKEKLIDFYIYNNQNLDPKDLYKTQYYFDSELRVPYINNKKSISRQLSDKLQQIVNKYQQKYGPIYDINKFKKYLGANAFMNNDYAVLQRILHKNENLFTQNGNEWKFDNPYATQYPERDWFQNDEEYVQQFKNLNGNLIYADGYPQMDNSIVLLTSPYFGQEYVKHNGFPYPDTPTGRRVGDSVFKFNNAPQASVVQQPTTPVQTNQQTVQQPTTPVQTNQQTVQQPTTPVQQPVQTTVNPAKTPVAKPTQQVQTQPKPQTEEEAFAEKVKQLRGDGKPVPTITHEKLLEYTGRLAQPLPSLNGMAPPKGMPYIPKPNPVEQQQTQQSTTDPSTPWYKKLGSIGKSVYNNLPTFGDAMSVYGMYTGMQNAKNAVLADRATDTPNKNYYANYGLAGLSALDTQKQFINRQYDYMNSDLSRRYDQILAQNRGSSMGINQMRAGDMAGLGMLAGQRAQMDTQRFGSLAQLAQQRMQLQNQRDAYLAQGEQARDLADRQDKSAFYTNWAQAQNNYSQGLMHLGGMFNHFAGERAKQNILNQYSKFGIYSDRYGNLYANDRDD